MQNVELADVVIFEAGDNWIDKCIAKLTGSNVSHVALYYSDENIIEMLSHGIVVSQIKEDDDGDTVHLMRLSPEKDPDPVIAAAKKYLDQNIKYDYADIILLAGLLIYRSIRPTPRWQKITDYIIGLACAALDKLLNQLINKSSKATMICSQLVYQCYYDCGSDYQLKIEEVNSNTTDGTVCLAELARHIGGKECSVNAANDYLETKPDMEALAHELYDSLEESDLAEQDMLLTSGKLTGSLDSVKHFLDTVEDILERAGVDLPIRALFVTPADLLEHTENLKEYATMKITRE